MVDASKYRLGARLGRGGMAEVYRGELIGAEGFSRPIAVKQMLPALSAEPDFEEMFRNEAQLAARLHHPNVVNVFDFDRDPEGRLFLVMELVEGTDLKRLMTAGPVPLEVAAYVIAKLLEALDYVHDLEDDGERLGLVHRDVTPHNVLMTWDGHVKLSDFGIAKAVERTSMTATGVLKGKIAYMSPEQIEGDPLDGRSDLFAVGIMLHELLTNESLFRKPGIPDRVVLNRILIAPIEAPDTTAKHVPKPLAQVCMRLLERERDDRYASAQEALTDLLATGLVAPTGAFDLKALLAERKDELRTAKASSSSSAGPAAAQRDTDPDAPDEPRQSDSASQAAQMQSARTRPVMTRPVERPALSRQSLEAEVEDPEPAWSGRGSASSDRSALSDNYPAASGGRAWAFVAMGLAVVALGLAGVHLSRQGAAEAVEAEPIPLEASTRADRRPTPTEPTAHAEAPAADASVAPPDAGAEAAPEGAVVAPKAAEAARPHRPRRHPRGGARTPRPSSKTDEAPKAEAPKTEAPKLEAPTAAAIEPARPEPTKPETRAPKPATKTTKPVDDDILQPNFGD